MGVSTCPKAGMVATGYLPTQITRDRSSDGSGLMCTITIKFKVNYTTVRGFGN